MLKKSITYDDYDGNEVTEDFYFNLEKLEIVELDLEMGGVEETLAKLNKTQDTKVAYGLFKKLILATYGEKAEDGKHFIKEDDDGRPLSRKFAQSPACSELIISFLQDPDLGSAFIEATLPAKLIAEAKKEENENKGKTPELPTAPPVLEDAVDLDAKKYGDFTRKELLEMPQEEFQALVGDDPKNMDKDQLVVAMQRKNR